MLPQLFIHQLVGLVLLRRDFPHKLVREHSLREERKEEVEDHNANQEESVAKIIRRGEKHKVVAAGLRVDQTQNRIDEHWEEVMIDRLPARHQDLKSRKERRRRE